MTDHLATALAALSATLSTAQLAAPSAEVAVATLRSLHEQWPGVPVILTPATAQAAPDLPRSCVLWPVSVDRVAGQMLNALESAPGALLCPHASRLYLNLVNDGAVFPAFLAPRYVSAVADPARRTADDFRHLLRETVGLRLSDLTLRTLLAGDARLSRLYQADPFALSTMQAALDALARGATGAPWPQSSDGRGEAQYLRIQQFYARNFRLAD